MVYYSFKVKAKFDEIVNQNEETKRFIEFDNDQPQSENSDFNDEREKLL